MVVEPSPSWPLELLPQHCIDPSDDSAHECSAPNASADDAVTLEGGGGGGGGGGGAGGEAAERESVVSASTMAQQTAAAKGTLQCRV